MIPYNKLDKIVYGGDYNPEQWSDQVRLEDMELLKAANIDIVTINVFSWARLQKDEDTYDFSDLDKIMDMLRDNNMKVCMATSTGAHPAWMARKYPDILRVDFEGRKHKFGGRHNSCPNSITYKNYASKLVWLLCERYKEYDNIVCWHISNEFGGECFCEHCEEQFRSWLKNKYKTLDNLNKAWNTTFWGHTMYGWEDVVLPDLRSEHFEIDRTQFQGISLDYRRFMSDSLLECYKMERDIIKRHMPDAAVTTNLMGFYKPLDYFKWAKEMDFISWDNYPSNEDSYSRIAMSHDLMRGIKNGEPFALMEQTPSVTNWLPYNALKRPGVMRLWSYQAVAHGADTVMFFQMRRSIGACEKYHGAVIDHVGTGNTRVYREIAKLGDELKHIGDKLLGCRTKSDIAIMFDWDNWWAIEYSAGPSIDLKYMNEIGRFYDACRNMNYNIDIISPETDLSQYKLVIAPVYYMVKGENDISVKKFVSSGGIFVTTFFSGYVQENDLVVTGGYPGKLRDLLGIWVEEEDALLPDSHNTFSYKGNIYRAGLLCDLLHTEGAVQVDDDGYHTDFYKGMPVLTCNHYGKGKAYYIATAAEEKFYYDFIRDLCMECDISPVLPDMPIGIEITSRENEDMRYVFLMNHNDNEVTVQLPADTVDIIDDKKYTAGDFVLPAKGVHILAVDKKNK
ncbi:MAG: beta-galactosidase [Wujia sp.]